MRFAERPLLAIALGGHALSDPEDVSLPGERSRIRTLSETFHELIRRGFRLLIVHGNGPQVGRLLSKASDLGDLDVHVAQTQGELGYLLAQVIEEQAVALVTTVEIACGQPSPRKPIGPVLEKRPVQGTSLRHGKGWRLTVPSPVPISVREVEAISGLSERYHVIAGGGGGVPVTREGEAVSAVVDKDYTAALLATHLNAHALLFATNVDYVYADFPSQSAQPQPSLTTVQARRLLAEQDWPEGTMVPKLTSAIRFVEDRARPAYICEWTHIVEALDRQTGTIVTAGRY